MINCIVLGKGVKTTRVLEIHYWKEQKKIWKKFLLVNSGVHVLHLKYLVLFCILERVKSRNLLDCLYLAYVELYAFGPRSHAHYPEYHTYGLFQAFCVLAFIFPVPQTVFFCLSCFTV